jgi:anaerobic selenocysteine-containing dehydrogenase
MAPAPTDRHRFGGETGASEVLGACIAGRRRQHGRKATRIVRGACSHDCPDTCAMHTTVEDGRATRVAGDPDRPITVGFLVRQQRRQRAAQPRPELVVHPDDAAARGIDDGARRRVFNGRGEFRCVARVSDDARAGVAVAPMGWWNRDYEGGRSSQATTSQELTEAGNAPIFNDNRVDVEAVRG